MGESALAHSLSVCALYRASAYVYEFTHFMMIAPAPHPPILKKLSLAVFLVRGKLHAFHEYMCVHLGHTDAGNALRALARRTIAGVDVDTLTVWLWLRSGGPMLNAMYLYGDSVHINTHTTFLLLLLSTRKEDVLRP